ncbi:hypothetical protein [Mycobacterium leprae]|uniref:Uncharacterized protein n=1 Tax=Mycobacterium leprae TaxID=1769 RepID=O05750_MYCLR|nr:hypothetical protein [Mycobacterium leprae]CAB08424.1 unknown [Mycobacterium leprae]
MQPTTQAHDCQPGQQCREVVGLLGDTERVQKNISDCAQQHALARTRLSIECPENGIVSIAKFLGELCTHPIPSAFGAVLAGSSAEEAGLCRKCYSEYKNRDIGSGDYLVAEQSQVDQWVIGAALGEQDESDD